MPTPASVWGARPPELGRRLLGGVGWFSLLDVELHGNFSALTSTLLSTVSKSRQKVFVLIEVPDAQAVITSQGDFPGFRHQIYVVQSVK